MDASVPSMGGTTLEMMMPSTLSMSRPAGAKRLRKRIPHSSAVCSWTVRSRHWLARRLPSNAPIVILLFPASRANSTHASCQNQYLLAVIAADPKEPAVVDAAGRSVKRAFGLLHDHPFAIGIGRY